MVVALFYEFGKTGHERLWFCELFYFSAFVLVWDVDGIGIAISLEDIVLVGIQARCID